MRVSHRFYCLTVLIVLAVTPLLGARTLYVSNTTGNDQNNGQTADQAVRTLQHAVALLQVGDTLNIINTGQAYHESLMLHRDLGTPDQPLLIEGNGAVLSGMVRLDPSRWTEKSPGLYAYPVPPMASNLAPVLANGSQLIAAVSDASAIEAGQCCWQKQVLLFKPAAGTKITDLPLEASLIDSGVAIADASYITVRNLISERHANDGYNIHGNSRGIILENIVSRDNGDDGCSIHEDGQLLVRNAWFHHNSYGIEDVHNSQSTYQHIVVEHNQVGVHFMGGFHQLSDSVLQNNQNQQLLVGRGFPSSYLGDDNKPFTYDGICTAKNLHIIGGQEGILIVNRGKVALASSLVEQSTIGILLLQGATLELRSSIVHDCETSEIRTIDSHFFGDYNLYFPGHLDVDQKRGLKLNDFQSLTQADAHSLIQEPQFKSDAPILLKNPFVPNSIMPGLTNTYSSILLKDIQSSRH